MSGEAEEMTQGGPEDRLVPFSVAAQLLGVSVDTLGDCRLVPVVRTFGGHRQTHLSWVQAALASARPGEEGDMTVVLRRWWADRAALGEVA